MREDTVVGMTVMYSDIESFSSDERGGHVKKTNKPMMEKKRRARINHCLSELKEILICDKHAVRNVDGNI
ncbi:Helix-loop-helix DNA-binding domain protein [Dictyocaulus viviparus]|uniref:Helix-loop-helix DNA-binding domain protein n=1 Tax=Dictyocaulus viviparus TaxID=29172 RepID=A0A0D8Y020_DICVI|nr:Helix-loop-helix DNA-binding domain protein [Dictyocaulus viviparus]